MDHARQPQRSPQESVTRHAPQMKRRAQWELTPRDLEMLRWVGRHGTVTIDQITRRFFSAKRTAYIRIAKLTDLRLLQRDRWLWNEPQIIRLTTAGARLVSDSILPASLVYADLNHSLQLVDLLEELARMHPEADVKTEREIRGERSRQIRDRQRDVGRGRMPDGLLTFLDGRTIAIELDRTSKRSREYALNIRAYAAEKFTTVWWFAPSEETATRLRDVVAREYADHLIQVFVWNR